MENLWLHQSDNKTDNYRNHQIIDYSKKIRCYNKQFSSPVDILSINRKDVDEIDNFYNIVQLHRQQFKSENDKLDPLKYFKQNNHSSMTNLYFSEYPLTYVKYKKPIVLPTTTHLRLNQFPNLPERKL
ncbi:hypothetical protein HCN44_009771 [Aphidius gifuensis]|uniref:Uncharacterized protein n=1 Tax=Aphidius gifuensis TaxID=684658 RepID=A0A835CYD0_APHGI|nr:uncharacterized protein LOC122860564 [Aphidius gifuensis]KAF7998373.1 hypothetical protein HCN44_009771 [Aphidius gifuensis]